MSKVFQKILREGTGWEGLHIQSSVENDPGPWFPWTPWTEQPLEPRHALAEPQIRELAQTAGTNSAEHFPVRERV